MEEARMNDTAPQVPGINRIPASAVTQAVRKGWQDFRAAPGYGLFFGGFYVVCGLAMLWVVQLTGQVYWLALLVFGFPLIGPFAAVGLYEISRRLSLGTPLVRHEIMGVIWRQKNRQLPSICAIIIFIFLFWSFIGHMIFALFLGLTTMTNISTSYAVFLTPNGLAMLAVGTAVGAVLAGILFSITVISLPMLLDREIDFVTAMILSVSSVLQNKAVMFRWAVIVAVVVFLAILPAFLGLIVVLPVLGHATWHLYTAVIDAAPC